MRDVIAASAAARIHRQSLGIDVGKDRTRAGHHHRQRGVGRRQRRGDHFVAGADVEGAEDQRDRIGAGADADRVRHAAGGGEFAFERLHFGSEHEPAARDHPIDGGANRRRIFAGRQRVKRNPEPT